MLTSKTVWAGIAMAVAGVVKMMWPELVPFIEGDPALLVGTGLGFIFARFGIAKNGLGK
jgi:hypothetical protein